MNNKIYLNKYILRAPFLLKITRPRFSIMTLTTFHFDKLGYEYCTFCSIILFEKEKRGEEVGAQAGLSLDLSRPNDGGGVKG